MMTSRLDSHFAYITESPTETSITNFYHACCVSSETELSDFVEKHSIKLFYEMLWNKSVCSIISKILNKIAEMTEPRFYIIPYTEEINRLLIDSNEEAAMCVLKLLASSISLEPEIIHNMPPETLKNIINCHRRSLGESELAHKIMLNICMIQSGLNLFVNLENLSAIKSCVSDNEIIKLRVLETLVAISVQSESAFSTFISENLLDCLSNTFQSDDPLSQSNLMLLIGKIASTHHGYSYLEKHGVIEAMQTFAKQSLQSPLSSILFPGVMKILCYAGKMHGKNLIEKYPELMKIIEISLDDENGTVVCSGLEAIASLASNCDGKKALSRNSLSTSIFPKLGSLLLKGTDEIKIQCLACLSHLLECKGDDQECQQISYSWFGHIAHDPLQLIMDHCKRPFPDAKCAGFQVLSTLSTFKWFQVVIGNKPGFLEFVLDRSTETDKVCKEQKFEVVKALALSPSLSDCFDQESALKIKNHFMQGPHYCETITEVAMEGQ